MSFEKSGLMQDALVQSAYMLLQQTIGLRHADARAALKASQLYAAKAKSPKAAVAAALLFNNHAFPAVEKLGPTVEAYAEFAIEMAGLERNLRANGNADHADIILAQAIVAADAEKKEIASGATFYIYDVKQRLMRRLDDMIAAAAADSQSPALVTAAQTAAVAMRQQQEARVDKVARDSLFAKTGLPAHPLVEKAYNDARAHDLKACPHVAPMGLELGAARVLLAEVSQVEPDVLAALLLNQTHRKPAEIEKAYGPRVAEIYAATAPLLKSGTTYAAGADDVTAAIRVVVTESWLENLKRTPKSSREDRLYDLERAAESSRRLLARNHLSAGLAKRLAAAAAAAEAAVHAPENTAIRKPGSPRPDYGW